MVRSENRENERRTVHCPGEMSALSAQFLSGFCEREGRYAQVCRQAGAHAFPLIELLIVMAILAILAAIVIPNLLEAQIRAKVSRAKSDFRAVAAALDSYAVDWSAYPPLRHWANTFETL